MEEQMIKEFNATKTLEEACEVAEKYNTTYAKLQKLSLIAQIKTTRKKESVD